MSLAFFLGEGFDVFHPFLCVAFVAFDIRERAKPDKTLHFHPRK